MTIHFARRRIWLWVLSLVLLCGASVAGIHAPWRDTWTNLATNMAGFETIRGFFVSTLPGPSRVVPDDPPSSASLAKVVPEQSLFTAPPLASTALPANQTTANALDGLASVAPAPALHGALAYAPALNPAQPGSALDAASANAASLPVPVPLPPSAIAQERSSESLRALAQTNADLTAMRRALDAYRRDDVKSGDAAASLVADAAGHMLLEWAAIRFDPHEVGVDRIEAFGRTYPDWPAQGQLRRRAEEAFVSQANDMGAVKAFFADHPPLTASGHLAMAEIARAEGREGEAVAAIRRIWIDEDLSQTAEQRLLRQFPGVLTMVDHRNRMERLLFKERWADALRAAAMASSDHVKLATARMAVSREAANAAKQLDMVPNALRGDSSYAYARALLLRRQHKHIEAAQAIASVTRDPAILVDGDEWWIERRILARKLLDLNQPRLAYAVARDHGAEAPAMKVEAEFHAGWIALRFLNDPVTAATHFANAATVATTPISIARAAYWQGRAAEAARIDARPFYSRAAEQTTAYYGQLAKARLGETVLPVRRPPAGEPTPGQREAARAIGFLYALGEKDLALGLFAEIGQRAPAEDLTFFADLALVNEDARSLLALGKAALQRGLPLEVHAFPTIGVPLTPAASANSVERAMVFAIARQESAFDNRAISSAGARGLMQLMPATAKATATRAGLGYDADRLTADATYNATIGAAHLGDLISQWRGSYILTFAGYNAGSGNVRKWIEAYGDPRLPDIDPVDWVERIPFTETRNYVQRVMENLQVYRGMLGEQSTLLIEADLKRGAMQ